MVSKAVREHPTYIGRMCLRKAHRQFVARGCKSWRRLRRQAPLPPTLCHWPSRIQATRVGTDASGCRGAMPPSLRTQPAE